MATGGPGSGQHVYGELFKVMTGVDLITVHYRGAGPALPELMAGRAQVMFARLHHQSRISGKASYDRSE
jgi:tripartite-type tricarboxylate transporter receptor subunit TctC